MQAKTFVIVGAGLAGAKAAEALREEGFDGRVVLIGDEAERPYERPPLSKEYLRGEANERPYAHPADFYEQNGIELLTESAATRVDPGSGRVVVDGGLEVAYDRLLIATGAEPRRLDVPGADLDGVRYLRTIADSEAIADRLAAARRVVVVGSGWIGAEIAASARTKGCAVTVIEMASVPLERVLGRRIGQVYLDLHRDHGTEFLPETTVDRFEGDVQVERVITRDGAELDADLVVVGIGVAPRTAVAESAGIRVDNGILVDDRLETSVPGVFAAGDVAAELHPFYGRRVRVEHWANALNQGPAAARGMLGRAVSYDEIPYFFSDQYDVGMEYSGLVADADEVVIRGDPADREFVAFWIEDGRVAAGMNVNVWDVHDPIRELIRSRAIVDRERLADPDATLDEVAAVAR